MRHDDWTDVSATTSSIRLLVAKTAVAAESHAAHQTSVRTVAQLARVTATQEQTDAEQDHQYDDTGTHYGRYPPRRQQQLCAAHARLEVLVKSKTLCSIHAI